MTTRRFTRWFEDGEKHGPFQSYEVRERIEQGELNGDELAWHKDSPDWMRLKEMDVFEGEFAPTLAELEAAIPPPLPPQPRPFVRFWARWFDAFLYWLVVFGIMRATGQNIPGALNSYWFMTLHMLPYLFFEAIAIHLWKTTPGKFLLGIRVQTVEGGKLPLGASVVRAIRVYLLGVGMHLWIFPLMCHAFSLWFTLRNGEAPWDAIARNEVRVAGPFLAPTLVFAGLFVVILALFGAVMAPAVREIMETMPELFPQLGLGLPKGD